MDDHVPVPSIRSSLASYLACLCYRRHSTSSQSDGASFIQRCLPLVSLYLCSGGANNPEEVVMKYFDELAVPPNDEVGGFCQSPGQGLQWEAKVVLCRPNGVLSNLWPCGILHNWFQLLGLHVWSHAQKCRGHLTRALKVNLSARVCSCVHGRSGVSHEAGVLGGGGKRCIFIQSRIFCHKMWQ